MLSLLVLLLCAAAEPDSGMEALILIVPWGLALSTHGLLGPLARWSAWRHPPSALRWPVAVYFALFLGAHLGLWGADPTRGCGESPDAIALATRPRQFDALTTFTGAGHRLYAARPTGELALALREVIATGELAHARLVLDAGAPTTAARGGADPLADAIRSGEPALVDAVLEAGTRA